MEQALKEIRRRIAAAPDRVTKWENMVLERYVESGLVLDPLGEMTDDEGARFIYRISPECAFTKVDGGVLPFIYVSARRSGDEASLATYRRIMNKKHVLVDEERKVLLDNLLEAILGGEG